MAFRNVGRLLRPMATALGGAAIVIAVVSAGGGEAFAQGAVRAVHGDWQIRCDTPPGAQNEQCALMQSVTAEDRPNVGLTVIVLKTTDQKSRLMRVVAPLGVLLPSGLGLKIDNNDVGRAGFVRCLPNGCVAEVIMDDKLIDQTAQRPDLDLHYFPDARGRHRLSDEPEGLWRRLRQAAVTHSDPCRAAPGGAIALCLLLITFDGVELSPATSRRAVQPWTRTPNNIR